MRDYLEFHPSVQKRAACLLLLNIEVAPAFNLYYPDAWLARMLKAAL